jgi:hypothetical protein
MAALDIVESGATQLPTRKVRKNDAIGVPRKFPRKFPRRKITLLAITFLLNVLHWGSLICLFTSVYQIASTPNDRTSIPSEVLSLTSVSYTVRLLSAQLTHTGGCNNIIYLLPFCNFIQAEDLDPSAKALFSDQEDILYCHPLLHRIVRSLAHNSGLGPYYRGTSANMSVRGTRSASLGDWHNMQHCPLGHHICFDLAVRALRYCSCG